MKRAVLFDFDGTLADTAPDLAAAVNRMRTERHLEALPLASLRPHASSGARGLLRAGFDVHPEHPDYEPMRLTFLDYYTQALWVQSQLFADVPELLEELDARDIVWGIVTNKATRFAQPIATQLGFNTRSACLVCGDTTAHAKPHPAPLLHAAELIRVAPEHCLYVGDDLRDIQAAQAAGMISVAVEYGYSGTDHGGPHAWNADQVIAQPLDLLKLL
jgi:phosphoglycolate phosphatase